MSWARLAVVIFVALVLQVCLLARFSYDGARVDVMVLLAICAGFVAGPERGATVGFAAGLSFDVVLATPLGLSALVYTVVGFAVGSASGSVMRSAWWIAPLVAAVASAAAMIFYAVVAEVLGQGSFDGPPLLSIVVVVCAVNALAAPVAIRAVRWTLGGVQPRAHPFTPR